MGVSRYASSVVAIGFRPPYPGEFGKRLLLSAAVAVCAVTAGMVTGFIQPRVLHVLVLMGAFASCMLALTKPEWLLLLILLLKSSLDNTLQQFTMFSGAINLNGLLNLGLVGLLVPFLLPRIGLLRKVMAKPFLLSYTALVVLAFGSIVWSSEREVTLREAFRLASVYSVFLIALITTVDSERTASRLVKAILLSSAVPILVGWGSLFTGSVYMITQGYARVYSTFWHPNGFSLYLIVIALICWGLVFASPRPVTLSRWIWAGLATATIVLTYTRIAWGAILLALAVMALLKQRRLVVVLPVILLLIVTLLPTVRARFADLLSPDTLVLPIPKLGYSIESQFDSSAQFRIFMVRLTVPAFQARPLLGHGWGTARGLALRHTGIEEAVHNDYWRLLLELGIVGLLAFLLLITVTSRTLYLGLVRTEDRYQCGLILGGLGIVVALLTVSITDNVFYYHTVLWYMWGYLGVVLGLLCGGSQTVGTGLADSLRRTS